MSALTSPQGPLPARVYWFRRVMVLAVVFLVVFGTARLFGGDDDGAVDRATQASASTSKSAAAKKSGDQKADAADEAAGGRAAAEKAAAEKAPRRPTSGATPKAEPTETEKPLPVPTGECRDEDVVVTPKVAKERRTVRLRIDLVLRSQSSAACTWQVSPDTVTVKIDSGPRSNPDDIWLSAHCPDTIPTKNVTVYRDTDTSVKMVWNGRRSDAECSKLTNWAKTGWYHVKAAAYAGEPTDVQFELRRPSPVTVTRTVDPEPQTKKKLTAAQKRAIIKARAAKKRRESEGASPSSDPSGAVEPNG